VQDITALHLTDSNRSSNFVVNYDSFVAPRLNYYSANPLFGPIYLRSIKDSLEVRNRCLLPPLMCVCSSANVLNAFLHCLMRVHECIEAPKFLKKVKQSINSGLIALACSKPGST
jgi:hypothetical protein